MTVPLAQSMANNITWTTHPEPPLLPGALARTVRALLAQMVAR